MRLGADRVPTNNISTMHASREGITDLELHHGGLIASFLCQHNLRFLQYEV